MGSPNPLLPLLSTFLLPFVAEDCRLAPPGYFKERWGKLSLVCTPYVKGRMPESEHSDTYHNEDPERRHLAAFFVPLDAIRDYFGDDIGLYTAYAFNTILPACTYSTLAGLKTVYRCCTGGCGCTQRAWYTLQLQDSCCSS